MLTQKQQYVIGAVGVFVVCDSGRPDTIQGASKWKSAIDRIFDAAGIIPPPIVLLVAKVSGKH